MKIKQIIKNWLLKDDVKKSDVGRWDTQMLAMLGYNTGDGITKPYQNYNVVHTAIKKISNACSEIPIVFYTDNGDISPHDSIYTLFKDVAYLLEGITTYMNLSGEAFLYMPTSRGQEAGLSSLPANIQVINPKDMEHIIDQETGKLLYWKFNGKMNILPQEISQIKFYNPYCPYRGLSPIDSIRVTMDADYAAQQYNKAFFENSAMPESILTLDAEAEVNEAVMTKLKSQLLAKHQGVDNKHIPLILQGGMKWQTLNVTQKEMDFLDSKKFNRADVLSVFGVHPFVAGYTEEGDTNRSTADTAYYLFYTNTIVPILNRIAICINRDICQRYDLGFKAKFDTSKIVVLKRDYSQRVKDGKTLIMAGFGRDEVNAQLDLGFPEVGDDTRYLPGMLVPVDQLGKEPEKEEPKDDGKMLREIDMLKRRSNNLLSRAMKKYTFDQRKTVLNKLPKDLKSTNTNDYMNLYKDIEKVFDKQDSKLSKTVKPIYEDLYEMHGHLFLKSIALDYKIINDNLQHLFKINSDTLVKLRIFLYQSFKDGETVGEIAEGIKSIYNAINTNKIVKEEVANILYGN